MDERIKFFVGLDAHKESISRPLGATCVFRARQLP